MALIPSLSRIPGMKIEKVEGNGVYLGKRNTTSPAAIAGLHFSGSFVTGRGCWKQPRVVENLYGALGVRGTSKTPPSCWKCESILHALSLSSSLLSSLFWSHRPDCRIYSATLLFVQNTEIRYLHHADTFQHL